MKIRGMILVGMGYFCIVVLSLSIIGLLTGLPEPDAAEMSDSTFAFGYYFGEFLGLLLFAWIAYLQIKFGKKFIRKANEKRKIAADLNEIGR
jgi:hypothetical protein